MCSCNAHFSAINENQIMLSQLEVRNDKWIKGKNNEEKKNMKIKYANNRNHCTDAKSQLK